MTDPKNYHTNAAALIVAAAEKSGLLKNVAQALCFVDTFKNPAGDCPVCAIVEELTGSFDALILEPASVIEGFYGEGVEVRFTDAELAPYLAKTE